MLIDFLLAIADFIESWRRTKLNQNNIEWLTKNYDALKQDSDRLQTQIDQINGEGLSEREKFNELKGKIDGYINKVESVASGQEVLEAKFNELKALYNQWKRSQS